MEIGTSKPQGCCIRLINLSTNTSSSLCQTVQSSLTKQWASDQAPLSIHYYLSFLINIPLTDQPINHFCWKYFTKLSFLSFINFTDHYLNDDHRTSCWVLLAFLLNGLRMCSMLYFLVLSLFFFFSSTVVSVQAIGLLRSYLISSVLVSSFLKWGHYY